MLPRAASPQMIESDSLNAIFFDAAGTLFYLTKTVGDHYALVGKEIGLNLNAKIGCRLLLRLGETCRRARQSMAHAKMTTKIGGANWLIMF